MVACHSGTISVMPRAARSGRVRSMTVGAVREQLSAIVAAQSFKFVAQLRAEHSVRAGKTKFLVVLNHTWPPDGGLVVYACEGNRRRSSRIDENRAQSKKDDPGELRLTSSASQLSRGLSASARRELLGSIAVFLLRLDEAKHFRRLRTSFEEEPVIHDDAAAGWALLVCQLPGRLFV